MRARISVGGRGPKGRVREMAKVILARAGSTAELSVVLCNDAKMSEMNRRWRGIDDTTDELSSPMGGDVLGDVVISLETATRQAEERGVDTLDEIRVLLAHGVAHLLGHDHHEPAEAERMARFEAELLGGEGLVARAGAG